MMEVKELSFSYDSSKHCVLKDISFSLYKGSCLAILGNNGSGKSTLLKCLAGINEADEGIIIEDGTDVTKTNRREIAKKVAYMPQQCGSNDAMVYDAVLLGRKPYIKWNISRKDFEIVNNIIKKLGIQKFTTQCVSMLSGGERQKVYLARALAQEPDYLFLDEPTSSLDPHNQHEILSLMKSTAINQNLGIAVVIHDLNLAVRYCDRFLFLKDSAVYAQGDISLITSDTIRAVYNIDTSVVEHNGYKVIIPN